MKKLKSVLYCNFFSYCNYTYFRVTVNVYKVSGRQLASPTERENERSAGEGVAG